MEHEVKEISVEQLDLVLDVLNHIPEFDAIFYQEILKTRLSQGESIILVAYADKKPIGCKIAYNRYFDGSIYSWLGGVLPEYRKMGVAQVLLEAMEARAREKLFFSIRLKTLNQHVNMLHFALKNGFRVMGFEEQDELSLSKIELIKYL